MTWEFERVAGPYAFTEGPVWDGEAVLFTDIPNDRIMRYDVGSGECTEYRTGTNGANGLKFGPGGRLYACEGDGRRIARYEPDGSTEVIVDRYEGDRLNSPNDLGFDPEGRLWFTDPRYGDDRSDMELDHESVFRVDPDDPDTLTRMTFDTTSPNGILVSPDGDTLYVAQSEYGEGNPRELRAYPIEGEELGKYRVLHNFYPHRGIDGMCLDEGGNIVACAGWARSGPGPMLYVLAPEGRILETHPYPGDRPTNCAFGDDDLSTLYATGDGGELHRARTDRAGYLGAP